MTVWVRIPSEGKTFCGGIGRRESLTESSLEIASSLLNEGWLFNYVRIPWYQLRKGVEHLEFSYLRNAKRRFLSMFQKKPPPQYQSEQADLLQEPVLRYLSFMIAEKVWIPFEVLRWVKLISESTRPTGVSQ